MNPSSRRILRAFFIVLGLSGLFGGGLAVRRVVLETQIRAVDGHLPFTLESALHYRRVKILHDRGFLPEIDPGVQHPEGIRIRAIDSVAAEPLQARLAGWFPESVPFAGRIRWIEAGWFCLGLPLLAIAVRIWTGSWAGGLVAGALYAVSIASVLRSTGQEISRENFAMPWLIASFAFSAAYLRRRGEERNQLPTFNVQRSTFKLAAAVCLAFALIGWDMIQYVIGIMTLGMSIHVLLHRERSDPRLLSLFAWFTAAIFSVGLLHPYYRFHGLPYSPLMVWMVGVVVGSRLQVAGCRLQVEEATDENLPRTPNPEPRTPLLLPIIIFGPAALLILFGLTGSYGSSYGHFAELIWAKIRFLNVKPEDPGLLTFYQRVMWVPALHSATWELTKWLFPFTLWPALLVAAAGWFDSRKRQDPLLRSWLLFFVVSLIAYIFLVRFHVFVALAVAVIAGWATGKAKAKAIGWRLAVLLFMAFAVMAEAGHTLRERENMGRPNVYYRELEELAGWLREEVAPKAVLANMGVSAYIAAYGKCPIVIHPKFEDPSIRQRFEQFGELMFGADERALRDWMDERETDVLVYAKGEFASIQPEYQMRYFVNHMDPPESVPARRFERDDDSLRYFQRLWGNRKYVVYQTLSGRMEQAAQKLADDAMDALQSGRLAGAEALAVEALKIDRHQENALRVMRHVGSLVEQGVRDHAVKP